jgi:ketosteroid isomerase-like protein
MGDGGLDTFEGPAAIRRLFEDWIGSYEDFEIEVEEVVDLGNGVVLAVVCQNGRPAGARGHVQMRAAGAMVLAEGLLARHMMYTDIDEARGAAERLAKERG